MARDERALRGDHGHARDDDNFHDEVERAARRPRASGGGGGNNGTLWVAIALLIIAVVVVFWRPWEQGQQRTDASADTPARAEVCDDNCVRRILRDDPLIDNVTVSQRFTNVDQDIADLAAKHDELVTKVATLEQQLAALKLLVEAKPAATTNGSSSCEVPGGCTPLATDERVNDDVHPNYLFYRRTVAGKCYVLWPNEVRERAEHQRLVKKFCA
jgi:hypothetical protein